MRLRMAVGAGEAIHIPGCSFVCGYAGSVRAMEPGREVIHRRAERNMRTCEDSRSIGGESMESDGVDAAAPEARGKKLRHPVEARGRPRKNLGSTVCTNRATFMPAGGLCRTLCVLRLQQVV